MSSPSRTPNMHSLGDALINGAWSPHGQSTSSSINSLVAEVEIHQFTYRDININFNSTSPGRLSPANNMCLEQDLCSCIVHIPHTSNCLSKRLRRLSLSSIPLRSRARSHSEDSIEIEEIDSDEESDNEVLVGEYEEAPLHPPTSEFAVFDEHQRRIIDSIDDLSSGEIRFSKLESGVKRSHSEFTSPPEGSLGARRRSFGKGGVGRRTRLRFEVRVPQEGMETDS